MIASPGALSKEADDDRDVEETLITRLDVRDTASVGFGPQPPRGYAEVPSHLRQRCQCFGECHARENREAAVPHLSVEVSLIRGFSGRSSVQR